MVRKNLLIILAFFTLYIVINFFIFRKSQDNGFKDLYNEHFIVKNQNTESTEISLHEKMCHINDFNFTEEEIKNLWKFKTYPKCPSISNLRTKIANNTITIKCHDNKKPSLIIDDSSQQYFGGNSQLPWWNETEKADIRNAEYVIAKCNPGEEKAFVFNRFNKKISEKAQKLRYNQSSSNSTRPLTVLLLTLDSVSRNSAYRNLPKSMNFLNKILDKTYKDKYSVYDFKQASIHGTTTPINMSPILLGESYKKIEAYLKGVSLKRLGHSKYKEMQKKSIWKYYSSLGFVTFFSSDSTKDYFSKATGRIIDSDHVLLDFWRLAQREFNYNEFLEGQRCIGDHNAHYFMLNYTYQFLANYKNHNRFAYAHISAAHENTGNIKTLDDDLVIFFDNVFDLFSCENEDFVLLFIGDHPNYNSKLKFSIKGFVENRVVLNFIIVNKDLEERMYIKENLEFNSDKLIGRFDINLSLKFLANFPYGGLENAEYNLLKTSYEVNDVINFFQEKSDLRRTCSHIGVIDELCLCNSFRRANEEYEITILSNLIELASTFINSKSSVFKCKKIIEKKILKFDTLKVRTKHEGWDSIYLLDFKTDNNIVEISAFFSENKKKTNDILDESAHPLKYFNIGRTKVYLQIYSINIINNCGIDLCIC